MSEDSYPVHGFIQRNSISDRKRKAVTVLESPVGDDETDPGGKWHCRICAKGKHVRRRPRTKRVLKKTPPEKLIIPEYSNPTMRGKAPLAQDGSIDEPKPSSSRRPLLVLIKLGSKTSTLGHTERPVDSDSSDSPDNKSTGNGTKDTGMRSSRRPLLERVKLKPAEKSEAKKPVEQKLDADDNIGSNKKLIGDDNAVPHTTNLLKIEGYNGPESLPVKKNQEILVEMHSSTERLEEQGVIGSEAQTDGVLQVPRPPAGPSVTGQQPAPDMSTVALQANKRQLLPESPHQPTPESDASKVPRERLNLDSWSEDELDSLWIGVRRHGRADWDSMLRDTKLTFSDNKTPEDLTAKWKEEQLKFFCESGSELSRLVGGPSLPNTLVPESSTPYDVRPHGSGNLCPGASISKDPSGLSKLNKLPHWLKDALSAPAPVPHPVAAGPALPQAY